MKARFSAPFQNDPPTHPASYSMATGFYKGVKRPGSGVDHPPHLAPRLTSEWSYTSTPPLGLVACSRVNFTLPLHVTCQAVTIAFDKTFLKLYNTQQDKGNISLLVSFVIKNHSSITILLSLNSKHYWEEELIVFLLYSEGNCIMLRGRRL